MELLSSSSDANENTANTTTAAQPERTAQIFDYAKTARFGVIRKLPRNERFRCDFKHLHETRELAEAEALRLARKHGAKFYVVEIQRIANGKEGRA